MKNKVVFGILTYNHSEYILEHLESIKFQIVNFGSNFVFKLVIADDVSRDDTVSKIKKWLNVNEQLFDEVVFVENLTNQGTCINYTKMWQYIDSSYFKITAGDDVYSYENIFEAMELLQKVDFVSGTPLILENGIISNSLSSNFNIFASVDIYKNKRFEEMLKGISVINTPNLFYNHKFLKNEKIFEFIRQFKVTEDFPMLIKISELYDAIKYRQLSKVLVYYRRTSGSTYIVKNNDFSKDKVGIFQYLINKESNKTKKILLTNRLECFLMEGKFKKIFFNLNYYVYFMNIIKNIVLILNDFIAFKPDVKRHETHYLNIRKEAIRVQNSI